MVCDFHRQPNFLFEAQGLKSMTAEISLSEVQKTSWTAKLIAIPVAVLALLIGYVVLEMDTSLFAKLGYAVGFILIGYWFYTPKSARHIIARQILSLVIIFGIFVVFVYTWAMMEMRPELFDGYDPEQDAAKRTKLRVGWGFWILIYLVGAFFASRRIYKSLERNIHLSGLFSRYVAPSVISQMVKSQEDFFKTQKIELSVLFVDLRGFTATSSRLTAEQVKDLINIFMEIMIPVAHAWKGTVDKTVGDEIMVLFGAPLPYDDHAEQAVKTAMALLKAHSEVTAEWKKRELPVLEMGIGINTGEMVVGNIGCKERVDYTVLGHHVNLGARLCGKAAGSQILISEFTRSKLSDEFKQRIPLENYVELEAKGIDGKVNAFIVNTV